MIQNERDLAACAAFYFQKRVFARMRKENAARGVFKKNNYFCSVIISV
jgi:hypothetical protein